MLTTIHTPRGAFGSNGNSTSKSAIFSAPPSVGNRQQRKARHRRPRTSGSALVQNCMLALRRSVHHMNFSYSIQKPV